MTRIKPAIDRLRSVATTLVLDHPFFGILKAKLDYRATDDPECSMMATDGRSIFYNEEWVNKTGTEELLATVAHEVMHPAMLHHTRRGNRDPDTWNKACDYAINPILKDAGFEIKNDGTWLIDDAFRGKSAEQIYNILKQQQPPQKGGGGGGKGGDGSGEGKEGKGQGSGEGPPQPQERGKVIDAQDAPQEEAEWTVSLQQATKAAMMKGNLPAGLKMAIDQIVKPRVDWRAVLRRWAQQLSTKDYNWKMPNRRFIQQGIYLPHIRSEQMPPIVIVYDSSGSTMSVAPVFMAEMQSIIDEVCPEAVYLVMADAAVQSVEVFERGEDLKFQVKGLGGTSFIPAFDWVDGKGKHKTGLPESPKNEIAGLIYLTDAFGDYPKEAPEYEVLWAVTTDLTQLKSYGNGGYYPPFGEVVSIEEYEP